jgi:hypothetical protein
MTQIPPRVRPARPRTLHETYAMLGQPFPPPIVRCGELARREARGRWTIRSLSGAMVAQVDSDSGAYIS